MSQSTRSLSLQALPSPSPKHNCCFLAWTACQGLVDPAPGVLGEIWSQDGKSGGLALATICYSFLHFGRQAHAYMLSCQRSTGFINAFNPDLTADENPRVLLSQQHREAAPSHTPVQPEGRTAASLGKAKAGQGEDPALYCSSLPAGWDTP